MEQYGQRVARSLHGLWEVYLAREASARFDLHLALGAAVMVGVPALTGVVTGETRAAGLFTLAAFLTSLATPETDPRGRIRQFGLRTAMLTAAQALGMLTSGHLWASAAVAGLLSLLAPLPGVAVTPVIVMVLGTAPQPGLGSAEQLLLFAAGSLWAGLILLVPFVGGRYGPAPVRAPGPGTWRGFRAAVAAGDPEVRYAVRLFVCVTTASLVLGLLAVPHASWALIGILTTLRPSWGQTHSRIVKRLVGTFAGCVLTALLLLFTPGSALAEAVVVTVLAAVARPVRGFNYGLWPVFATPLLLLLTDFDQHLGWVDVAERLGNNLLGALLAAAAALLLWPAREEGRIPERLATLLDTHARFLERVAVVVEFGPVRHREFRVLKAEAATADLRAARARLATRRGADPELLDRLDDACGAAGRLRALVTVHRPYDRAREVLDPAELLACAGLLRDAAAAVTPTGRAGPRGPGPGPAAPLTDAAYALAGAALATASAAVRATRGIGRAAESGTA
ncbi:FUSC family protein [Streptomyces sp. NBC_00105]|uniref:FUSC family protein n=1 Tax=Streptomyces sp. NBC_00105 TaxID=2903622 RepID=UPI00324D86E7